MAEQAFELAHYEAEMEKKKIDIDMQKQKIAKQMRFEAQLEEKEVDLLAKEDDEFASSDESFMEKSELESTLPLQPPLPKEEKTANWVAKCYQATTKRPLNSKATVFAPHSTIDIKENISPPGNLQPTNTPPNENRAMTNGPDGTTDERVTDTPANSQAVLLRVTTLQAMQQTFQFLGEGFGIIWKMGYYLMLRRLNTCLTLCQEKHMKWWKDLPGARMKILLPI